MAFYKRRANRLRRGKDQRKMNIKRIEDTDYERLEAAGGYVRQYGRNVRKWTESNLVTADDCYVFESDGAVAGGICFRDDTPDARDILDFALIDVKSPDGAQALLRAVEMAAKPETKAVGYNLYNDTEQYRDILNLFLLAGFLVVQEKKSYIYEREEPPRSTVEFTFRSVAEVGEEKFISTVKDVTVGTLDKLMADDAIRLGGDKAAREYVSSLKELDFEPDWWRLGYFGDQIIGLVLPQRFSESIGGINYIGVLPRHRGHGYGKVLLAEGTRILLENGIKKIYADIDTANHPLAAALEQAGYTFGMEESVLSYRLPFSAR